MLCCNRLLLITIGRAGQAHDQAYVHVIGLRGWLGNALDSSECTRIEILGPVSDRISVSQQG